MPFLFYLDDVEIDEPLGFAELKTSIVRDPKTHGIAFEASLSPLQFDGAAGAYITAQKNLLGIKANIIFEAMEACGGYDYISIYRGRLNLGQYREKCGDRCTVTVPVEEESCITILKSRADQKVDLDKTSAADGFTVLAPYVNLGVEKTIPAREIDARVEGYSTTEDVNDIQVVSEPDLNSPAIRIRPTYADQRFNAINDGQLIPNSNYTQQSFIFNNPISPQLLFNDNISCFNGAFNYTFRFKGRFRMNTDGDGFNATARIETWDGSGGDEFNEPNIFNDATVLQSTFLYSAFYPANTVVEFDVTLSGTVNLTEGMGLYGTIELGAFNTDDDDPIYHVEFDPETYVLIEQSKLCPTSEAELYLIHESLSRIVESITNGCIRVKSEYYGRTDSQPFQFDADGDGGVRAITSGLKLRRADNAKIFASLKEMFEGLTAIDNVGMGTELDPDIPGHFLLRVEALEYFYQQQEILRCPAIPAAETDVIENEHYSRIEVGYDKWEVEDVNGLDEINSNREYVTSIDSVNNTLLIKSKLITGSYAIETTRQQSFAATGAADTKYDNEIFLLCLFRGGYLYSELEVEQGNILSPANIFSPDTVLNYRLSPVRNLMRWYRTIASAFPNIGGTDARLSFQSGTGNIIAEGEQASEHAKIEDAVIGESDNILMGDFAVEPTPITKPERITFEYPLSSSEYETIRANPYGYVSYQCGANGAWLKGWILSIEYARVKGMATIILKKQWQS